MKAVAERYGPVSIAALSVVILLIFKDALICLYLRKVIDFSNLYSSVMTWASIQTGFVFAIFGFVAGKADGFVGEVKNTPAMVLFNKYLKWATILGFTITIITIPFMVGNVGIDGSIWGKYGLFCAWAFMSIWSFLAFARVAYIFGIILQPQDKKRIPG